MKRNVVKAFALLLAVGCDVAGSGDGDGEAQLDPLTAEEAEEAGAVLVESIEGVVTSFGPTDVPLSLLPTNQLPTPIRDIIFTFIGNLPTGQTAVPVPCSTSGTMTIDGDYDDIDEDGVIDNLTITFDECSEQQDAGGSTYDGALSVTDTDLTGDAFAFESTVTDLTVHVVYPEYGCDYTITSDGTVTGSESDGTYTLVQDSTAGMSGVYETGGEEQNISITTDWTTVYTPTGAWIPGEPMVDGVLSVDGSWALVYGDHGASSTISTTEELTLEESCFTGITAGEVVASWTSDGSTANITATWDGCGEGVATYAGPTT